MTPALPSLILNKLRNKKILITGGTGYIGTALTRCLHASGCDLTLLTRTLGTRKSNERLQWVDWNSETGDSVHLEKFDIIFYLAAQTSYRIANDDPARDYSENIFPLLNVLKKLSLTSKKPVFVFTSTASIFGIPKSCPVDETFPDAPMTTYCLHKKLSEQYLSEATKKGIIQGVSLRIPNVYGPGIDSIATERHVINQWLAHAMKGQNLTLYGKGHELRDFIYIDDLVRALCFAAARADHINAPYRVLSGGSALTLAQAAQTIQETASPLGCHVSIDSISGDQHPLHMRHYHANDQLFRSESGWEPLTTFTEGILRTFQTMKERNVEAVAQP